MLQYTVFKVCTPRNTGIVCRAENEKTVLICKQNPWSSVWQSIFPLVATKLSHYAVIKVWSCWKLNAFLYFLNNIIKSGFCVSNWDLNLFRFFNLLWKFNAQYTSGFSISCMCWYSLLATLHHVTKKKKPRTNKKIGLDPTTLIQMYCP